MPIVVTLAFAIEISEVDRDRMEVEAARAAIQQAIEAKLMHGGEWRRDLFAHSAALMGHRFEDVDILKT